jgi:cyclophilin family peptidyl-prolyl cis-trans isomerase
MAELERRRKRQTATRRGITILVILILVVGIYAIASHHSSSSTKTHTTSAATKAATAQSEADKLAVAAGCPKSPTAALKQPTWSHAPPMTINSAQNYTATVKTDVGTFTIVLDAKDAPKTVNNFVFLADKGYYNCVSFYRVIPGFMNQTGSPAQSDSGPGPGYGLAAENIPSSYATGDVAMAASSAGPSGDQFFIVVPGGGPQLSPPNYPLFGTVSSGLSVVEKINSDGGTVANNGVPPTVIHRMLKVTITTT